MQIQQPVHKLAAAPQLSGATYDYAIWQFCDRCSRSYATHAFGQIRACESCLPAVDIAF